MAGMTKQEEILRLFNMYYSYTGNYSHRHAMW